MFLETEETCTDHQMDFFFELAQSRKTNNILHTKHKFDDLLQPPTPYDSPAAEDRYKYTY